MKKIFTCLPEHTKFHDNTYTRPKAFILKRVDVQVWGSVKDSNDGVTVTHNTTYTMLCHAVQSLGRLLLDLALAPWNHVQKRPQGELFMPKMCPLCTTLYSAPPLASYLHLLLLWLWNLCLSGPEAASLIA